MRFKRFVAAGALLFVVLGSPHVARAGLGDIRDDATPGPPYFLNLTVYFDFPVDEAEASTWFDLFNASSALLYNATEEQVQFGQITLLLGGCPLDREIADVIVSGETEGARADVLGLGERGRHIYISRTHKATGDSVFGQLGLVQQIGRYAFGLEYEHNGAATQLVLPAGTSLDVPVEAFFCAAPENRGPACVMDGGATTVATLDPGDPESPRVLRTEFCTPSAGGIATAHYTGFSPQTVRGRTEDEDILVRNLQQVRHGTSTWETLQDNMAERGLPVFLPFGEPEDDLTGFIPLIPGVTWIFSTGCIPIPPPPDKLVLVLDRSGSMLIDNRIGLAKIGARLVVDNAPIGQLLGVVSFATDATVDFPVQPLLSQSVRAAARSAIDGLVAFGSTNVTDGLNAALQQILATPRFPDELIVLLADGDHNQGDDPIVAGTVQALIDEGIAVNTIAIGTDITTPLLEDIAEMTGGVSATAVSVSDLPALILLLSGAPLPELLAVDDEIAPGESVIIEDANGPGVFVDEFVRELIVRLSWTEGDLNLNLFRPGESTPVAPTDPGVTFEQIGTSQTYQILTPPSGTWQMQVDAIATLAPQTFKVRAEDPRQRVQFTVTTTPLVALSPEPVLIEAAVGADGTAVTGATVRGTITRPDSRVLEIELFDDGKHGHGDARAGDGIYANYFGEYAGSGAYDGRLSVGSVVGTRVPPEEEVLDIAPTDRFEEAVPFRRQRRFNFTVVEILTLPTGPGQALHAAALGLPDPEPARVLTTDVLDEVVLGLRIGASFDEPILLERIVFRETGFADPTAIDNVKLYIDRNDADPARHQDGAIEATGPFALPVGISCYGDECVEDGDDAAVVFEDVYLLQPGEVVQLLVAYEIDLDKVRAGVDTAATAAGVTPLALLLVVPALLAGRIRRLRGVLLPVRLLLFTAALTVLTCGGGGGGGGGGAPAGAPGGPLATYQPTMPAIQLELRGAVSGQPIVSGGPNVTGLPLIVAP